MMRADDKAYAAALEAGEFSTTAKVRLWPETTAMVRYITAERHWTMSVLMDKAIRAWLETEEGRRDRKPALKFSEAAEGY